MSRLKLAAAGIATLAMLGTAAYSQEGRRGEESKGGTAQQAPPQNAPASKAPAANNNNRGPSARGVERGNAERVQQQDRGPSARGAEKRSAGQERATEKSGGNANAEGKGKEVRRSDDANRRSDDRRKADVNDRNRTKADGAKSAGDTNAKSDRDNRKSANETKGDRRDNRISATDTKTDRTKSATPADATTKGDRDRTKSATTGRPGDGKTGTDTVRGGNRVQLTEQQRTTIRQTIVRERPQRVTNVNVDIRIGRRLPRTVSLRPLPVVLINDYPNYRNYRYVYVRDSICIVDPVSYEIVEVIDARDNSGTRSASLSLSGDDERFIYSTVIDRGPRLSLNLRLGIGAEVPRSVEVHRFPDLVVERVPRLRDYRYVIDQDQVVVLNPSDYEIALVISR